jgi:hypothetical protein
VDDGQISIVTRPKPVFFSGLTSALPVRRSKPLVDQFVDSTNFSADSSSPVGRSITST